MCTVKFTRPCSDCPFRRDSTPGWTGDSDPEWFVESALSDYAEYQAGSKLAPCHQTVDYTDPDWPTKMDQVAACAGSLIFAQNNCKTPRDPERERAVKQVDADHETVFTSRQEFIDHHRREGGMQSWVPRRRVYPVSTPNPDEVP